MSKSSELSNESYDLYDRVMHPLTAHQEQKTRKDRGMIRGRHSTSYSSTFDQPSSSHLNDDDDGNGEGTSRASTHSPIHITTTPSHKTTSSSPTPPNAPSKTPSTNQTSSSQENTSSSFQSKLQISPPSSNEPTSPQPLNSLLDNISDVPPRPLNPQPLQKYSDEECLTSRSEDEEYAIEVRDFKKFFKRRENALDAATQIILLENVQNHQKTRTKELLSEVQDRNLSREDDEKVKDETFDLEPDEWIKDRGCSKHMTSNRKLFSSYKAYNRGNVIFGSNLRDNILSKGQICDNKCRVTFFEHDNEITKDGKVIGRVTVSLRISNLPSLFGEKLNMDDKPILDGLIGLYWLVIYKPELVD
ncbi:hypothetical protein Tco_0490616 [Tanacetum coccineum]